jgi:type I restriction enzyme S subunit
MNWPVKRLNELSDVITKGTTPTSLGFSYKSSGVRFLRAQNINYGKVNFFTDDLYIDEDTHKALARSQIVNGDLLVSIAGSIGRSGIVLSNNESLNCNQAVAIVRLKKEVNGKYISHALGSQHVKDQIINSTVTGVISNLSLSQLGNLKIPLPPLAEQQRIATLLDTADNTLMLREQAIAKLDQLAESVFIDMFGDPLKPKCKFETIRLGQLITEMRGGASLKPEDFVESGFPILHKGAIKKNGLIEIDLRKKTFATVQYANHKKASVVTKEFMAVTLRDLVPTGPSIGLIVNLNDGSYNEYLLAQGAYGFKIDLNRITPEYLIALSNMPSFREVLKKYSVGSTQIHMRGPVFTGLQINLPDISLQQKFSQVIKNIWKLRSVQNSFLEKEKVLMNSLQHQSFAAN